MAADWGVPKGFSSGKQARKHAAVRNCRIVDRISPLDDTYSRDRWSGVPSHPIGRVPQPSVTAERRVRARGLQGGLIGCSQSPYRPGPPTWCYRRAPREGTRPTGRAVVSWGRLACFNWQRATYLLHSYPGLQQRRGAGNPTWPTHITVKNLTAIRPFLGPFDQTGAHRIESNIFPFLGLAFR